MHRLLHAAEAVGQQRFHREQRQIDAQIQQAGAERGIQDGVHCQIDHSRAEAVHQRTGQQHLLQRFGIRVLIPQGDETAQQAGQHAGGHQQQRHSRRQHHSILAGSGQNHQRGKAHALHDHRVIQEYTVVVGEPGRVFYNEFSRRFLHCAAPFPVPACGCSRWYRRVSVRSIHAEMLLTTSSAKHTPVSYTP